MCVILMRNNEQEVDKKHLLGLTWKQTTACELCDIIIIIIDIHTYVGGPYLIPSFNFLYSILNNPSSPTYLTSYFQLQCSNHNRYIWSTNNFLLCGPFRTSEFNGSSFVVRFVFLWNKLPREIRMSTNTFSYSSVYTTDRIIFLITDICYFYYTYLFMCMYYMHLFMFICI